ncbi:uncharacterized protein [Clytia hemisphaerica]
MTYKYLGVKQHFGHGDSLTTKTEVDGVLQSLVGKAVTCGLDSKITARIFNSCVAGKARYYLATGLWTRVQSDVQLDRHVRSRLSEFGFHYRTASVDRLYLPRHLDGRGLASLAVTHDQALLALASYCQTATCDFPRKIWEASYELDQQNRKTLVSRTRAVVECYDSISMAAESGRLSMSNQNGEMQVVEATDRRKLGRLVLRTQTEARVARLREKAIHGVFFRNMETLGIEHCSRWLVDGLLAPFDEAKMTVAQDGTLKTRKYCREVLKEQISPICRRCGREPESVGHILSACDKHKFSLYKNRHDEALRPVHSVLCDLFGVKAPAIRKAPPPVLENDRIKVLWDPVIVTTVDMTERRPDMVVFFKETKKIVIVEQTCPWESRLNLALWEKRNKYAMLLQDLMKQYQEWSVKQCTLVMGVMGSFEKDIYVKELSSLVINDEQMLDRLLANVQRATILGSVRVIKNHLAE